VLNLYNGNNGKIKDQLIRQMKSIYELEEYIEKTEDVQLAMMVEIVKEYGNEIPHIIRTIKEKHVQNDEKEKAEMIFSTVHRCKGMEYDAVQLVNDFITEKKLEDLKNDLKQENINAARLNEEINLLYVALTRTKNKLYIPEDLVPVNPPRSNQIHILKLRTEEEATGRFMKPLRGTDYKKKKSENLAQFKSFTYDEFRKVHKDAYKPWTQELDDELTIMYCEGVNVKDMAKHFGRTKGAIRQRIIKLELEELYG
jgi:superfamily I DNA/RNA helicase